MRTVKDILQEKGLQVYSISPDAKVYEALQLMVDKNVGALMVTEADQVVGLISERDYARKIVLKGKFVIDAPVGEIMSVDIIGVGLDEDVEGCMELKTISNATSGKSAAPGDSHGFENVKDHEYAELQKQKHHRGAVGTSFAFA